MIQIPHRFAKGVTATSDLNRRRRFIINAFYWAIILAFIYLGVHYLLGLLWPFFCAFLFAWIMTPAIRFLTVKCHIKHTVSVVLCLIIFFAIVGSLLIGLSAWAVSTAQNLVVKIPTLYTNTIEPALQALVEQADDLFSRISPEADDFVQSVVSNLLSSLSSGVTTLSGKAVSAVSGWATKLPSRLLAMVICVIATVFITGNFPHLTAFLMRQLPERSRHIAREAKATFVRVIGNYGKSYGLIMCMTFAEVFIGLLIIRQSGAFPIALAIAVFDIFPIVGAGMILIPWGVVSLLTGATAKGIGLLALWAITIVVRQIAEPRIVGHQVGLHPLVTLFGMYTGSKLFGALGLFGLPITFAIIKSLDDTGVIHIIKKEGDESPAPFPTRAAAGTDAPPPDADDGESGRGNS